MNRLCLTDEIMRDFASGSAIPVGCVKTAVYAATLLLLLRFFCTHLTAKLMENIMSYSFFTNLIRVFFSYLKTEHMAYFMVYPFPNTPFWDRPKFKEAADDDWNVAIKGYKIVDCIENIMEICEIAQNEHVHLFPQCFPKAFFFFFFFSVLKWVYMEERVNILEQISNYCDLLKRRARNVYFD